jgi:perosamine synthetase
MNNIGNELYQEIHKNLPISCADIVLKTYDGGFVLIKRGNEPLEGEWWVLGGRIKKNETIENAARRKIREDVGIEITDVTKIAGGYETIFEKDPFGHGEGTHTINNLFTAEISDEELKKITVDKLISEFKVFKYIDPSWNGYLKKYLQDCGFTEKPTKGFIPVCEPSLHGNELKYVTEAVKTGWISSAGSFITQFEEKFAKYCGVKHGVSCSNGTTALHLAIEAMGIGKGDEIITPTFSMAASTNSIIYAGAKPIFIDSELDTWNMDVNKIEEKITPRTKAIMVVHTYGHPIDMDKVMEIAARNKLYVIEDAAEAHGAEYKGRKTGSLGHIACFSFYANKIITTGEGGMVVTNNEAWAERARKLRNHFFGEPRFLHQEMGYNYRLTNMQAAIGLAQLEKLDEYVEARRHNAYLYNYFLKNVEGITLPPEKEWCKNVYWMYGVLVDEEKFGMSMDQLCDKLKEKGIDTRTFFIGMHKQPAYNKDEEHFPDKTECPIAEKLENDGFYLPSSSHLTVEQIEYITDSIKEVQNDARI